MSEPAVPEGDQEEFLHGPGALPWRVLIVGAVVILGILAALAAARAHDSRTPALAQSTQVRTPSSFDTSATEAAVPIASNVLLPGLSTGSSAGSGRLVFEMDVVNASAFTLTVRYPIVVVGPARQIVTSAQAGLYERGPLYPTTSGGAQSQKRLITLPHGHTVALVVAITANCRHPSTQERWTAASLQAFVRLTPATGAATFPVGAGGPSFPSMVHAACSRP